MDPKDKDFLDKAVEAVEARLDRRTAEYRDQVEGLHARIKEMEQNRAPGFNGGMPSIDGPNSGFVHEVMNAEPIRDFLGGKGASKTARATFNPGGIFNSTTLGEEGSPQEPSDTLVQTQRLPGVVPGSFRALNFLDFIPRVPVSSNKVDYPKESSWTNDAAETSEGETKPESDLEFSLVEENIRTIAHWLKVSKQALEDSPWLQQYMLRRMMHGVRKRLQSQLINGNGTSPNLSGLTDSGNHTAFSPTTGEHALDSLNRAKYAVISNDYEPNFILMNPADVGAIERLKTSSEEAYLLGTAEGARYVEQGLRGTIWELPVVATNDVTSGKFLVADVSAMMLLMRSDAEFLLSEQDDTNVQKNLITLRTELRAGLAVFVPAAIQYGDLSV